MAGRKRVIQGDVEKALLHALTSGLTIRLACYIVGIDESVYFDEVNRNPEFAKAAMRARYTHLPEALEQIRKAGKVDWKAADRLLQLVAPDDFGTQRHRVEGGDKPIAFTLDFTGGGAEKQ